VKTRHYLLTTIAVAAAPSLWRTNNALALAFIALWLVISLGVLLHKDPVMSDLVFLIAFLLFILSAVTGRYFDLIRLALMLFAFVRALSESRNWFHSLFIMGLVLSVSPLTFRLGKFSLDYAIFGYGLMLLAYLLKSANAFDILTIAVLTGLVLSHLFRILYLTPVLVAFLMIVIAFRATRSKTSPSFLIPFVFIGSPILAAATLIDMWRDNHFTVWTQFFILLLWMAVVAAYPLSLNEKDSATSR